MRTEPAMADSGMTRRSLVQGVGLLAGATVLAVSAPATGATAEGTPARPSVDSLPENPPSADATTAGLTYDTYIGFSFMPLGQPLTDVVSTLTGVYVPGVNTSFYIPVNLPSGSMLKELSLAGSNSSGVIQMLGLYSQPFANNGGQLLGSASLVGGSSALRSVAAPLDHVVDGDAGYYLLVNTRGDGTQNAHGARIGYTSPGVFTPLPVPIRIYDSRPGGLPGGGVKGKFANHEERVLDAHLGTGVPYGASSVLVNVAATNTNPGGFFSLFKNGVAWPGTSTLNWGVANTTVSSLAATQVAPFGNFKARCEGAGGADLIVDVVGWFS